MKSSKKRTPNERPPLPAKEERRRRKARNHLYWFVVEFWEETESFEFIHGWHAMAICLCLMGVTFGTILNLLMNIPPRTGKSRIFTMYWPAWEFARGMKSRHLFTGNDQELVIEMSVECRRIIESEKFQRWFPTEICGDQNTKKKIDLANGGRRQITSVGSRTTGKGGNRLGADDIHDAGNSQAQFVVEVGWFCGTWSTRKDPGGCSMIVNAQRLDWNDISGYLIRTQADLWTHLCLPLHYDPERHCRIYLGQWYAELTGGDGWWEDPREIKGELLWNAVFTPKRVDQDRRTLGERLFRAQFEQDPLPDGGSEFKPEWLVHRWSRILVSEVERFIISIDASFKGEETSDWCVIALFAKVGPKYKHCGQIRAKLDYVGLKQAFWEFQGKWRALKVPVFTTLIEDKANGTALIAEMQRSFAGIVPISPRDSKIVRYRAISGVLEAAGLELPAEGAVIINDDGLEIEIDTAFVLDLVAELLAIPGGPHDDQADTIEQVINYCEAQGAPIAARSVGRATNWEGMHA